MTVDFNSDDLHSLAWAIELYNSANKIDLQVGYRFMEAIARYRKRNFISAEIQYMRAAIELAVGPVLINGEFVAGFNFGTSDATRLALERIYFKLAPPWII